MIHKIISALVTRFAPKGHWKFTDHDGYWYNECSICGGKTENHDGLPPNFNFCPYCGKPMGNLNRENASLKNSRKQGKTQY